MRTAVIIPAYNEALTIADVLVEFAAVLPEAELVVVDNASTDDTRAIADRTIAENRIRGRVLVEPRKGKANAVRTAFNDADADVYVMVDADRTYPAEALAALMAPVLEGRADMTVGDRLALGDYDAATGRSFHRAGNDLVRWMVNLLFDSSLHDIMSGYRCFRRSFVESCPILCDGFELETEMTLFALDKKLAVVEVPIQLRPRPSGSESKLDTFADGARVLRTIVWIFKDYRPLTFFLTVATVLSLVSLALGIVPIVEFLRFRYVYRVPTAILASGIGLLAMLSLGVGLILDTVARHNSSLLQLSIAENKRRENSRWRSASEVRSAPQS